MNEKVKVNIIIDDENHLPFYASELAAGADIRASNKEEIVIAPGSCSLIPTGVRVEIPAGYEIQVRSRSGLALKNQIFVLNSPGTIDADYRGEIKVILMNLGKEPFIITYGMKVAQLILAPVTIAEYVIEKTLATTARGEGGFGHTGTH